MPLSARVLVPLLCLALLSCASLPEEVEVAAPADGEACAPVERPPLQAGSHLIEGAEPPVPYSSLPPTSGWHASGALDVGVHDHTDPLSEAEQVSILEADGVVISYHELPAEEVRALTVLVEDTYAGRVAVTPYDALEAGHVALTAWGALQRCASLDLDVVRAFIEEHLGDDVQPGH